jgi:predicted NUDIX family NTP pyrophosphohydrolase
MAKIAAGLLLYRLRNAKVEVLLVHPGGPFFRNKDLGAWTIPKGEPNPGEELLAAAKREFAEETGMQPVGEFLALPSVKQRAGKIVHAWAFESDFDTSKLKSNTFHVELPPKSGKMVEFPEVDRAEFFDLEHARQKINPAQAAFLDNLEAQLATAMRSV